MAGLRDRDGNGGGGSDTRSDAGALLLRSGLSLRHMRMIAALDDFVKALVVAGAAERARTGRTGSHFHTTVVPDLLRQQPDAVARAIVGSGAALEEMRADLDELYLNAED